MNAEEKDLVWLPKKLAEKVKSYEDNGSAIESLIIGYLDESKREVKNNLESLEDDVLEYRGLMVKAKNAFKEAKEEQLKQSYELWEDFDKDLISVRAKVDQAKNAIKPIKDELENIKELMSNVNTWDIEKLLDILRTISDYLSYNGDTANILKFLFENYKKDKS